MTRHIEKLDYGALDDILNQIEPQLTSIAEDNRLKMVNLTRWRWDEPSLMLKWQDDDLAKGIYVFVVNETTTQVRIECNAWRRDKEKVRMWRHQNINQVAVSSKDEIKKLLKIAYLIVAEWKKEDLQTIDALP